MSDRSSQQSSGGRRRRLGRSPARAVARSDEDVSRGPGEWTSAFSIGGRRRHLVFGEPGKGSGSSAATSKPLLKWLIGGVLAVVALAAAVGVAQDIYREASPPPAETSDVVVTGRSLPSHEEGPDDPAMGTVAPGFRATTFDGLEAALPGGPTVIGFYAHWCLECKRELPRASNWLLRNGTPPGMLVVAVSTEVAPSRSNYPPSAWFEGVGWPDPVVRDSESSEIARAYGLTTLPYTVAIDGRGRVVARVSGELTDAQWEALLAAAAGSER